MNLTKDDLIPYTDMVSLSQLLDQSKSSLVLRNDLTHCEYDDFEDILLPMDKFYAEHCKGEKIFMRKTLHNRAQLFAVLDARKKTALDTV